MVTTTVWGSARQDGTFNGVDRYESDIQSSSREGNCMTYEKNYLILLGKEDLPGRN